MPINRILRHIRGFQATREASAVSLSNVNHQFRHCTLQVRVLLILCNNIVSCCNTA